MVYFIYHTTILSMPKCNVMNVEWCDFVVYSNGEVLVDRIVAD